MGHQMPPDDDPIIRSLRESGIRPLRPRPAGRGGPGRRPPLVVGGLILLLVLLFLVPAVAARLADWLWYREVGFERVFFTKIVGQWTLGIAAGAVAFIFLYANARIALRGMSPELEPLVASPGVSQLPRAARAMLERGVGFVALIATLFFSVVIAFAFAAQWQTALQLIYRTPFGVRDPVFGRDVGYYVFTLPAIELVLSLALGLVVIGLFVITLPALFAS